MTVTRERKNAAYLLTLELRMSFPPPTRRRTPTLTRPFSPNPSFYPSPSDTLSTLLSLINPLLLPIIELQLFRRNSYVSFLDKHSRVHERRVVLVHRFGREDLSIFDQRRVEVNEREQLEAVGETSNISFFSCDSPSLSWRVKAEM